MYYTPGGRVSVGIAGGERPETQSARERELESKARVGMNQISR